MNVEKDSWIPSFVQGLITTNFQNYSGMRVVDRQNFDMVKAEQKLSEGAESSDSETIEIGKLTNARSVIIGNITKKTESYALTFSITDSESGESKSSYSIPDCKAEMLEKWKRHQ